MGIDIALVLVVLTLFTGFFVLLDTLFFAKKRAAKVGALETAGASEKEISVAEQEPIIIEYSKSFFPVLAIVLVLRSFLFEPFQIPSGSMIPTLREGDFILVNKFTYGLRLPVIGTKMVEIGEPKRGDVMVFYPPHEPNTYYIKRVIGIPGDLVKYDNKTVYINGKPIEQIAVEKDSNALTGRLVFEETLGEEPHQIQHFNFRPGRNVTLTLNEGEYFMLGDNRDNSRDSRFWGVVNEDKIVGKAVAVWMHWNEFFSIPSFSEARSIQ